MPAPATVSSETVAFAAAELAAQGRPISGGSLRSIIRRGRPDRLLALWREQQPALAEQPAVAPAPAVPPAMADALAAASSSMTADLATLFSAAWATAHELAQSRIAHEAEDARQRIEAMTVERDEALTALDEADAFIVTLKGNLDLERQVNNDQAGQHAREMEETRAEAVRSRADADAAQALMTGLQEQVSELIRRIPVSDSDTPRRRGASRDDEARMTGAA